MNHNQSTSTAASQHSFRYSLGRLRGKCPQCGRQTFKFYVDNLTGRPLDPELGRCNRENNCGYHRPPRSAGYKNATTHSRPIVRLDTPAVATAVSYIDESVARQPNYILRENNLFCALSRWIKPFHLMNAFESYTARHSRFLDNATAFWLRDRTARLRSAKVMAYDPDGHRLKQSSRPAVSYAHTLLRLPDFKFEPCFFGEYQAWHNRRATILAVESEKTALILAAKLMEHRLDDKYVAIGVGGASQIDFKTDRMADPAYRCNIFVGRNVVLLPDADMTDRWIDIGRRLFDYCLSVRVPDLRLPPFSLTGSQDIADYIIAAEKEAYRRGYC